MRRLAAAARTVWRSGVGLGANRRRAIVGLAATLFLVVALVVTARRHVPRTGTQPRPTPPSVAGTRVAFPRYAVTRTPDAARACYLLSDTGAVALDTLVTAAGVVVVDVAVARDRATIAYVEARQALAADRACLGRVVRASTGWAAYMRSVDPGLGLVDRVLVGETGAARIYRDRRAAGAAVEEAAHRLDLPH